MKRAYIYYFALYCFALFGLNGCKNNDARPEAPPISVIVEKISELSHSQDISVSGNVEGNKTVRLGFMVAGKIDRVNYNEGEAVRSGQLLATVDSTSYSIAKEIADVQVNQITDEHGRLKMMYERKSLSESDFKKVDFALQGALAQQKLHSKNLSDTRLYSTMNGILLKRLAEPGEIVSAGMPVLVVSDISKVKVSAYIPENQLQYVHIGQKADVRIDALGQTFSGEVAEVGGLADAMTRAFTIKIEVANSGQTIRPGMIAEVTLSDVSRKTILSVPASSILRTPEGQAYVFVVDIPKGQAFQRYISLGGLYGDKIEVVSGLSNGETIVLGGQQKLTNGSRITVTAN